MRTLFEQVIPVHYHLFSIRSGDEYGTSTGVGGQRNGLCGAADPGSLTFTTGLHTGRVPVRVELHDTEPPPDRVWEEVVEVSYLPDTADVWLQEWGGPGHRIALDPRDYRVRFSGVGFDNDADERTDPPERYLVQFWPAPPAPDRVVKQTSAGAASWHRHAQQSPPPPTREARAEAARLEQAARDRQDEQWRREDEARYWSGRVPTSERLLQIAPWAVGLAAVDRDLVDELDATAPATLRAMAAWAARNVCDRTGIAVRPWVAEALDALDRGAPAPPAFTDFDTALAHLLEVPPGSLTQHVTIHFGDDAPPPRIDPRVSALFAVTSARDENQLLAAINAVKTAATLVAGEEAATVAAFRAAFRPPGAALS
ncbi:hypothetical protein ACFO1B_15395 [Dactylosporangium siamense]|uniref:Uncharacterized protein n=1 Tax=Dactylosporangium siamense TaxID=685454 RepID=A0A919UB49_9ACTN|nr:hypothetical protein [Dactylosporangium siamense]GIG45221.1 hypothetical protein Dsi01nite_032620 [Dactylosporangium siamense]